MKLIHTADLHIGKIVNEFSMIEEQKNALTQILAIAKEEEADALIIAGDIYDRSVPSAEAVVVFDEFLNRAVELGISIFIISGNHDSPERVGFAQHILKNQKVYIAGIVDETIQPISVKDSFGEVNVYLLPFAKPATIRHLYQDETIQTCEDGVRKVLEQANVDENQRNVLVTHHFVTSKGKEPEQCDSESELLLGGTQNVDAGVFNAFDYVALGHIHGAQRIGRDTIRYSGSPIKYSFSEVFQKKSVTVVDIREKGDVVVHYRSLTPIHDMRKIVGALADLTNESVYSQADVRDYLHVTLTDKQELFDPMGTLRSIYPNVMQIAFEKFENRENASNKNNTVVKREKSMYEHFADFYADITGDALQGEYEQCVREIIDELGGESV